MLFYTTKVGGLVVGLTGFNLSGKEQTIFLISLFPYQSDYPLPPFRAGRYVG
jgi:hypothetical protein